MSVKYIGISYYGTYRSQIMFIAFWLSCFVQLLLIITLFSLSQDATVIKSISYFQGKIKFDVNDIESYDIKFYAGVNMITTDCDYISSDYSNTINHCPDETISWSDVECNSYFENCNSCKDSSTGASSTIISAFITQFLSINSNLQRSTGS